MNDTGLEPPRGNLDRLLDPASVAVIGGSDDPTRIGGRPIRYMREAGYPGVVYPVNPKHRRVQGVEAWADIESVPGQVDLAIVAVPASRVVPVLEACARKGVAGAVVFSAGFAEIGGDGERLQDDVARVARATGLRVVGPNCLGLYNADQGLFATFSTTLEDRLPRPGPIGLVSQSGAYGSHLSLLAAQRGMGIRYWVTTGNEADLTVPECIEWLARREDVSVIVAYAEGIKTPETLRRGLQLARANRKPVIVMKVGTTAVGARAARSHTASLAGADAVFDAVLRQFGAYRAHTTEDMLDVAYAASFGQHPKSRRVALLSISGGVGVQMADAAVDAGLDVAPMSDHAQTRLKRDLPYASPRNPVDITAQAFNDIGLVSRNLQVILEDGRYDAVVAFFTYVAAAEAMITPIRDALSRAKAEHPACVFALSIVGPTEVVRAYESAGIAVFEDPTRAVRAVAALARIREWFDRASPGPVPPAAGATLPETPLSEHQAARVLADAGIPMHAARLARHADEAVEAAVDLGFPVALKVSSPGLVHKTEIGGVALGVTDSSAVRTRFDELMSRGRSAAGGVDGVLVSPMAPDGVDMVVGVSRDAIFGPVVMVGLGGVFVEVLEDVAFRVAPFHEEEARRMIAELRAYPALTGSRGAPRADLAALASALARISLFAATHDELESAEINPLRVFAEGQGAVGLDAVVIRRDQP